MISKRHFIKNRSNCFCQTPELIENYEQAINDKTQIWVCHHRDEVKVLPSGVEVRRPRKELIENGRYYNCPPNELIFLTKGEHQRLHTKGHKNPNVGVKISKALKGKQKSLEHRKKLSKSHLGISPSNKNKSASIFGEKYIDHFGYGKSINEKQYRHEHYIFTRDGKCSWE